MLLGPMVTPGATKTCAATHELSLITIGLVTKSNPGLSKRCDPVQRNARCEIQQFDSMVTGASDRIETSSPIQTWSPTLSRHGNEMLTPLRIITP
ncbi:hypothetical protein Rcae01_06602 [Novipirellula caenicola]|uniref:Uncharacterized protein n=1 Tax=Novipirellula caenicola TaxID=1536901 RepID=A0ABP9W135_9BACT